MNPQHTLLMKFNNLKIHRQLLFIFGVTVFVIFLIVDTYMINSLIRINRETIVETYLNSLEKVTYDLKTRGTKVDTVDNMIASSKTLQRLLSNDYTNDFGGYYEDCNAFSELVVNIGIIDSDYLYRIYHEKDGFSAFGMLTNILTKTGNNAVKSMYTSSAVPEGWSLLYYRETDKNPYWVKYSLLRNTEFRYRTVGILMTFIQPSSLSNLLFINDSTPVAVFSQSGELLYSTQSAFDRYSNGMSISYEGDNYLYYERTVDGSYTSFDGLIVACLIPIGELNNRIMNTVVTAIFVTLVGLGMASLLFGFYVRRLSRRLTALVKMMKTVGKGHFAVQIENAYHDEIGTLYDSFNEMSRELNDTVDEYINAELEKHSVMTAYERSKAELNEARLLALQRQIDPHYLFNSLENIRMGLILKGDRETANVIMSFATGFRALTVAEETTVYLERELTFAKNYITVLKYRFPGVNFEMSIAHDDLLMVKIPVFSIQPIVENAVIHGILEKGENGNIRLEIDDCDGKFNIVISDDGRGMTQDEISSLWVKILGDGSDGKKGVALRNLYARYKLIYAGRFEFHISSVKECGSRFEIHIRKDENGNV